MAKQEDMVGASVLLQVRNLFTTAVEDATRIRTKKYKTSNDSLRTELAAVKAKHAGVEAEFKFQVGRAKSAETTVAHLEDRVKELKITVQALQTQNAKMVPATT